HRGSSASARSCPACEASCASRCPPWSAGPARHRLSSPPARARAPRRRSIECCWQARCAWSRRSPLGENRAISLGLAGTGCKAGGKLVRLMAVACAFLAAAAHSQSININSDLLAAARRGDTGGVRALLERGAAVNSRNRLGDSPLLIAAKNGITPMALLVLERGADVSEHDNRGKTGADMAAEGGHRATLELLRQNAS